MKELLISFQECSFGFTKKKILNSIDILIHNKDKIALVGKNGVGKTTFMDILSRYRIPDEGETWFRPNLCISYLKQNERINTNVLVREYLIRNLKNNDRQKKNKLANLCNELNLNIDIQVNKLSGGQKRKLHLIEKIINNPNLLLLDEPTNHLDIDSILWLENFLNKFDGAFLAISHDRKFLENSTNKVFWMDRGKIKISPKGFENFEKWSNDLIDHEKREIKNKDNLLKQELDWISKGVKARRKRNTRRLENISSLKKQLKTQKSEFIKSISKVKIEYSNDDFIGNNLIGQLHNISKSYNFDNKTINLFSKFNYKIHKGEKIGVIGKNGTGKTTFFKLLTNEIKPDQGVVKLRKSIDISYFDQHGDQFIDLKSIKENMIPSGGDYVDVNGRKIHICGYLKNFLFDPSEIESKVSTLSGGQRNRLLLAKILSNPKQLMILDEPTNDLDIETLDILIEFISEYKGTVLISSHDRDFLDKTVNKIFYFHGNANIEISNKTCTNFLNENIILKTHRSDVIKEKVKKNYVGEYRNKKDIKRILQKIEKSEREVHEMQIVLNKPDLYNIDKNEFENTLQKIEQKKYELKKLEEEWLNLEEQSLNFEDN